MDNIWQLQEAKSRFSEMVSQTLKNGAQIITRRGAKTVVVIPYEEYENLTKRSTRLVQFLLDSPLPGSGLEMDRDKSMPRNVEIEP